MKNRAVLAIHSTGTGKTLTAAASMRCLLRAGIVKHVAVLVKKSAVKQWHDAVHSWDPKLSDSNFSITTVHKFLSDVSKRFPAQSTFLVVDEAHEFTNPKGTTTQQLLAYAAKAKRVLLLTATPIVNQAADLLPLIAMLQGTTKVMSAREFDAILASPRELKKLVHNIIDVHMIDKAKDPNYPKLIESDISVPMSPSTWTEYKKQEAHKAPFLINLRRLSLGYKECEKCKFLVTNIPKWIAKGEGKIVIYTSFLEFGADKIRKLLRSVGVNTLVVDGSTSAVDRRRAAVMFNRTQEEDDALLKQQNLKDLVKTPIEPKSGTRCGHGNILATRTSTEHKGAKGGKTGKSSKTGQNLQGEKVHYSYQYFAPGKKTPGIPDTDREYMESLIIPPAWTPAEACKEHSKIAWVAKDRKGRWQYRYSEDWRVQQEYRKVLALKAMDSKFWKRFESVVHPLISSKTWTKKKQLAIAAKLLQTCHFRVGTKEDDEEEEEEHNGESKSAGAKEKKKGELKSAAAKKKGESKSTASKKKGESKSTASKKKGAEKKHVPHYGLMTLQKRHVKRMGRAPNMKVVIEFIGKSGKINRCELSSKSPLGSAVSELANRAKTTSSPLFDMANAVDLRGFLGELRPGLRPKDFRTYFANYKLLNHLRSITTNAIDLTGRQRSRILLNAVKEVSTALNNAPKVARTSYVFSGLDVLYLADPTRFQSVLAAAPKSADTSDVLDRFIRLFDENVIDWRAMLRYYKETKGLADFVGAAQVLLITDAGSESIDLAGTRHIVFLDQPWTPALEAQIIGRGQRYGSHKSYLKISELSTFGNCI